jgi:hypothetical protein
VAGRPLRAYLVTTLAPLPRLHDGHLHIGADPKIMRAEMESILIDAARNAPRSLQSEIGPSELGTPCARKLGYRLADAPEHNFRDPWRPTVGTATHAWIAEALAGYNQEHHDRLGFSRYLIECRIEVGRINGAPVIGSADCYDRIACEVIDWKIVGTTTLKTAKRGGPHRISKQGYRVQAHLYGRGFVSRGLPVHAVNIAYLPASGELRDAVWQREEYDESVALQALERANAIARAMAMAGAEVMVSGLPRTDDLCTYCGYWNPAADERYVWDGCTGVDRKPSSSETLVTQLIGE